jgi:hypothetical protein
LFIAFYDAAVSLSCGKQNFEKGESGAAHGRKKGTAKNMAVPLIAYL